MILLNVNIKLKIRPKSSRFDILNRKRIRKSILWPPGKKMRCENNAKSRSEIFKNALWVARRDPSNVDLKTSQYVTNNPPSSSSNSSTLKLFARYGSTSEPVRHMYTMCVHFWNFCNIYRRYGFHVG